MSSGVRIPGSVNAAPHRKLMKEIQFLSLVISTLIIITVQILSLLIISNSMLADLRKMAVITADEACEFLKVPLYNLDEAQAFRIGGVLLSSGRISGIILESTATGLLINQPPRSESLTIPSITRDIVVDDILVGTVTLYFSDAEISGMRSGLTLIALSILAAVIVANILADHFVIRDRMQKPITAIIQGIDAIAAGRYDRPIAETGYADVNTLICMMNEMAGKILTKNRELQESNSLLEQRVMERTAKLENSLQELQQAQDLLIESEKLSALGQLSAGMAHELNTPLGAIISSNGIMTEFLDEKQQAVIDFIPVLTEAERCLFDKVMAFGMRRSVILEFPVSSMKAAREFRALLEGERIPHFKEVAEILQDIGITENFPELADYLRTDKNMQIIEMANETIIARRMAEIVAVAARKAAGVVAALRSYLAPEAQGEDHVVDIVKDLENVLVLMHNMLKYGIQVRREFGVARVLGSSDKLGQVWINLIRNAAQAMDFKGELALKAETRDGKALVTISDSGSGVPPEIQDRIFDPFFTTKRQGEGMGLGLDICKRIIEAHNGTISFTSVPGRTEFTVTLPAFVEG